MLVCKIKWIIFMLQVCLVSSNSGPSADPGTHIRPFQTNLVVSVNAITEQVIVPVEFTYQDYVDNGREVPDNLQYTVERHGVEITFADGSIVFDETETLEEAQHMASVLSQLLSLEPEEESETS